MAQRRDVLVLATKGFAVVGMGYAAYTLMGAVTSGSPESGEAVSFDLDLLRPGEPQTVTLRGKPVVFYLRTEEDIARSRSTDPSSFRDGLARNANLPPNAPASDENRSVTFDPRYVVFENACTREGCVLLFTPQASTDGHYWQCPCCGSLYDTEGRAYRNKATENTRIPAYEQAGASVIRLGGRSG